MVEPERLQKKGLGDSSDDEDFVKTEALDVSAKAVFRTLNPDGKAELQLDEVLERIHSEKGPESTEKRANKKNVEKIVRKLLRVKGEKGFSEEDMKRLNKRFMDGHLPRLKKHRKDSKNEDEESEEEVEGGFREVHEGMRKKILHHAVKSIRTIWRYAEKSVSRTGRTWIWTLLPTGQISTLLSFLLFSYVINASFLAWFVPISTLTISVGFMLVSSIRLIRGNKRFTEFKAWADFLDEISATEERSINTGRAEEKYVLKHASPYVHFFIATIFCVMGFATSDKAWVLSAELGILSFLMYGTIFYTYAFHKSRKSLSLFAIQFLAALSRGFRCGKGSEVWGFIAAIPIPCTENHINFSIPSLLRLVLLISVCSLGSSRPPGQKVSVHIIKVVLPHLVALAWFDMADLFFCFSSFTSVVRASLEYLALLFAMPALVLFVAYTLIRSVISLELTKLAVTLAVILLTAGYFLLQKKRQDIMKRAEKVLDFPTIKKILSVIGLIILGYVTFSYRPSGLEIAKSDLQWRDYRDLCLYERADVLPGNNIGNAAACREFKGYGITWDGTVETIDVVKIDNKVEDLLNFMPHSVASWLSCMYGEPYPNSENCKAEEWKNPIKRQLCSISHAVRRPCHIEKHNIYTFKIAVLMPSEDETRLYLEVPQDFYALVSNLQRGFPVRFTGTITEDKTNIAVKVLSTSTDGEEIKRLERKHRRIEKTLGNILDQAFDALCDFAFYPIVSFSEDAELD